MDTDVKTFDDLGLDREVLVLGALRRTLKGYSGTYSIDVTLSNDNVVYHIVDSNTD